MPMCAPLCSILMLPNAIGSAWSVLLMIECLGEWRMSGAMCDLTLAHLSCPLRLAVVLIEYDP